MIWYAATPMMQMEITLPLAGLALVKALDQSGWTMWLVLELRRGWNSVEIAALALTTVSTVRMLGSDVKVDHDMCMSLTVAINSCICPHPQSV